MFIFERERERETEREQGRVRDRGRHRIWSGLQALSCQHRARRGARTHEPRDYALSRSGMPNRLSHPDAPDFYFNVYLFLRERERERQSMSRGGAKSERGSHRFRSRLQALSRQHRARCGAQTHKPWNHDLSRSQTPNRLSHPGTPQIIFDSIFCSDKYLVDKNIYLFSVNKQKL